MAAADEHPRKAGGEDVPAEQRTALHSPAAPARQNEEATGAATPMASVIKPNGDQIVHKCITPQAAPQAPAFPTVSYRLLLQQEARREAARRGVDPGPIATAMVATYRASGNRFAARRAGFATADALAGRA